MLRLSKHVLSLVEGYRAGGGPRTANTSPWSSPSPPSLPLSFRGPTRNLGRGPTPSPLMGEGWGEGEKISKSPQ